MGTTAEKLTYLNETKSKIKDSINSLGGNITSQTTFRQYATELDSIYSSLPKVSGTGSILSLNPTLKGRLGSTLKGNTLQDGTPTPSTPVEIQSVTGLQNITVCGKNLFDKDNVNILNANLNNQKINSANAERTVWFKCEPNTTYTFTKLLNSPYTRNAIAETTDIPTINMTIQNFENYVNSPTFTYTTSETAKYLVWWFYNTSSTNYTQQELLDSIQVELGTQATEYEPYQSQEYEINLGKNLFDGAKTNIYFNSSKQFQNQSSASTTNYIPAEEGDIFTISVGETSSGIVIASFDTNYNCITRSAINTQSAGVRYLTYTCPANTKYIIGSNYNGLQTGMNTQLEKGSQATSYSPYFTPIKLNKIGDYQDYINGTPDNWSIKRNIKKYSINTSQITLIDSYSNLEYASFPKASDFLGFGTYDRIEIISNKTQWTSATSWNSADNINKISGNANQWNWWLGFEKGTGLTTIQQRLENTDILYPITETTEAITNQEIINQLNEIYNLQSYNGTTNITITSEDLELIMTASAIKGEA